MQFAWAFPDPNKPEPLPTPISPHPAGSPIIGAGIVGIFNGPPVITGPSYGLDICQRCDHLMAKKTAPVCKHCHTEEQFHRVKKRCNKDCLNCKKPLEVHFDGKCPFEASDYKTTKFEAT